MSEPQQPKEYIITEEQLSQMEDEGTGDYGDSCVPTEVFVAVRSRPHSAPAQAPNVVLSHMPSPCSYLLIEGMNVRCLDSTPRSRVDCDHHVNWHCWDLSNQREIAIARKAREDVLDKVIAWKRKHGYWFTVNRISGEKRYHFEPDRFEEFIKEIRHNAPQTEQEQPR